MTSTRKSESVANAKSTASVVNCSVFTKPSTIAFTELKGKKILLGISGGIAAYKTPELVPFPQQFVDPNIVDSYCQFQFQPYLTSLHV